nr:SDR family oxidoreductase [Kibdelosporangium sp. MJ126-NF4]CEL15961.1 hypothetical protein [Kibdelosporangium sp. MJ126-NF4]CTQ93885.1 hypothetical protein [Kibdelosporangium sp. MJ126-NF4]
MHNRILVTGGTGLLGRLVVDRLVTRGHEVRVLSRTPGDGCERAVGDLRSGDGVREAVADVDVIVHCATAFGRRAEARITRTLVAAARQAGRPHLAYISIVGVDRVPLGYYQGKMAAERTIADSGLPYTILRATQFHDILRVLFAKAARSPVMPVPDFRFQPVDVGEVADRLTELAIGEPGGRVPDFAGPHIHHACDFARAFALATGRRRLVLPVRLPGRTFRAYRDGGNLAPDHAAGSITFEDYLAAHPAPLATSYRGRS